MSVSAQFLRIAMQRGLYPFGFALKTSSQYTYYINAKQFEDYIGIKVNNSETGQEIL